LIPVSFGDEERKPDLRSQAIGDGFACIYRPAPNSRIAALMTIAVTELIPIALTELIIVTVDFRTVMRPFS
jgi:hypothetical protein